MDASSISEKPFIKDIYLTDGGLETSLIYLEDIHLPHFAAFHVLNHPEHRKTIDNYFRKYMDLASQYNTGYILESATWRANPDWGYRLGYSQREMVTINREAIAQLKKLKEEYMDDIDHILISGCLGPRYDGYSAEKTDKAEDARIYHSLQVKTFKDCGVDMVTAITMTNIEEALGISFAAKGANVPVVISFTVEIDGVLPDGNSLKEAIITIDRATGDYPLYYMINCAHPEHFERTLQELGEISLRIKGIRANASCKSHAELDESTTLDKGDKKELALWYGTLKSRHPQLKVFGGCCGTDHSHIEEVCQQLHK